MNKVDYSLESEDEFYEDFSGWTLTDRDLNEILARARAAGDVPLRRLVKQAQYFRFLLPKLLEVVEGHVDENPIIELARAAVRSLNKDKQ
jgi:hypothetical protein